ncbi:DUF1499 domain-containing protein [Oscillatoria sp. CS-180]|uniref:DUF1499 domain-containing protein n=1 Tax=Oscillatoria sp. CS-180 TaxID=3021720 RepID=UPI0023300D9E|nr:DUF1499 domain-containing protein [Oscillatoria sp. CS-180]MDB9526243.1 DUF1499 domain-containing protein [Oscillatoria sp. CS-180]
MSFIVSFVLAIGLLIMPVLTMPAIAASPSSLAALPGFSKLFAGEAPELGLKDGHLSTCPQSPNCVVSQGADADHAIAPIPYTGSREQARDLLIKVLGVVPRTEIVAQTDDYIRVESASRLMGFVDDAEFYLPEDESVIHVRSAARLGESDLGVNRRRLEQIRFAMQDLGA